jgi:hypothetical protein
MKTWRVTFIRSKSGDDVVRATVDFDATDLAEAVLFAEELATRIDIHATLSVDELFEIL